MIIYLALYSSLFKAMRTLSTASHAVELTTFKTQMFSVSEIG